MSTTLFYILGLALLPIGTLLVTYYAGWSLDRELERSRRERFERKSGAVG
ncbi:MULTISPECIES: hypothetical protein [unclassified Aureimonas]|nr:MULTISPECIES: hypothetical protein [unclassified Aureimonas]